FVVPATSQHAERIDVDDDAPLKIGTRSERGLQRFADLLPTRALDQELRAVLAAQLAERRRCWSEHADVARSAHSVAHALHQIRRVAPCRRQSPRADDLV